MAEFWRDSIQSIGEQFARAAIQPLKVNHRFVVIDADYNGTNEQRTELLEGPSDCRQSRANNHIWIAGYYTEFRRSKDDQRFSVETAWQKHYWVGDASAINTFTDLSQSAVDCFLASPEEVRRPLLPAHLACRVNLKQSVRIHHVRDLQIREYRDAFAPAFWGEILHALALKSIPASGLSAKRYTWFPGKEGELHIANAHDFTEFLNFTQRGDIDGHHSLPSYYYSELAGNAFQASANAIRLLVSQSVKEVAHSEKEAPEQASNISEPIAVKTRKKKKGGRPGISPEAAKTRRECIEQWARCADKAQVFCNRWNATHPALKITPKTLKKFQTWLANQPGQETPKNRSGNPQSSAK